MEYILNTEGEIRTDTGQFIPKDPHNRGYQKYLQWIAEGNAPVQETESLEEVRETKLRIIENVMEQAISGIIAKYTHSEISSWPEQVYEARLLESDPEASVPLLDNLAEKRGIILTDLKDRVLAKAATFSTLSGNIIGQKQAIADELEAATTLDELEAVSLVISTPVA